jgi:hypothetical protein
MWSFNNPIAKAGHYLTVVAAATVLTAPSESSAATYHDFRFTLRYVDSHYQDAVVYQVGNYDDDPLRFDWLAESDDIWGFEEPFGYAPGQEWKVRVMATVADDTTARVNCINSPVYCGGFYGPTYSTDQTAIFGAYRFWFCVDKIFCDGTWEGVVALGEYFDFFISRYDGEAEANGYRMHYLGYGATFEVTSVEVVPLPASFLLLMTATAGLGAMAGRRLRKSAAG